MKVSVCIPTYNQGLYLEKAVLSAYNQTLAPFEIIVSNDYSNDNTKEILDLLSSKIPILKVIHQPTNLGISRNTDICLRSAKGDFIVRLDSDDFLHQIFLERLHEALLKNSEAGYAHAAVQEVDQFGNFLNQRKLYRKAGLQTGVEALKGSVSGYRVAANIIMFRKTVLIEVGYISAKTNFAEDYYLAAAIAAAGYGNVYIDEILSCYRVWVDKAKVRQRRKISEIVGYRKVFEEVLEPAYSQRGWSRAILRNSRASFACNNADCLGWEVYTNSEKDELVAELKKLSSSIKVKFFIWVYLNGFGKGFDFYRQLKFKIKSRIKKMIFLL